MSTSARQDSTFGTEFLERFLEWVSRNCTPTDVFSDRDRMRWAEDNGYIKEEDA